MIHLVGYVALAMNLVSMAMKNVLHLRIISLLANGIYLIYGILLNAPPFIIGCGIAILIHMFHIFKLKEERRAAKYKSSFL